MTGFLDELGKKLTERWAALVVFPGVLYVGVGLVALVLGHDHAVDIHRLREWIDSVAVAPGSSSPSLLLLATAAALTTASVAGLAAAGLGHLVGRAWTVQGRRVPARWLVALRVRRWRRADAAVASAIAHAAQHPTQRQPRVVDAILARDRIAVVEPARPTWIGDRLRATDERIHRAYDLDLVAIWPRLWMLLPEPVRSDLTAAHDSYATAARTVAWGLLYLALAALWWPATVFAAIVLMTGQVRARSAAVVLAELTESAVELHAHGLAAQLGLRSEGELTRDLGLAITTKIRKDWILTENQDLPG